MKLIWRLVAALLLLIALGASARASLGEKIELRDSYGLLCDMEAPPEIAAAYQAGNEVEFWVEDSAWPFTPICHWRVGNEMTTLSLLDESYTYEYYGGLLVAGIVVIVWAIAEVIVAVVGRRRRRLVASHVPSP